MGKACNAPQVPPATSPCGGDAHQHRDGAATGREPSDRRQASTAWAIESTQDKRQRALDILALGSAADRRGPRCGHRRGQHDRHEQRFTCERCSMKDAPFSWMCCGVLAAGGVGSWRWSAIHRRSNASSRILACRPGSRRVAHRVQCHGVCRSRTIGRWKAEASWGRGESGSDTGTPAWDDRQWAESVPVD